MKRITRRHYDLAIDALDAAREQLDDDGQDCAVCGDAEHRAYQCLANPLVALRIVERVRALDTLPTEVGDILRERGSA